MSATDGEAGVKSTKKTSVREISPGTFRVTAVRGRSAITGRFVTSSSVHKHPRTTVVASHRSDNQGSSAGRTSTPSK